MNLTMMASAKVRAQYLSTIPVPSGTVYQPYETVILENVAPEDAQALEADGYIFIGVPPLFGAGAPSIAGVEGQNYYDTAASYAVYIFHSGSWEAIPGGGITEVTSVNAGIGVSVDRTTGDVTITVGTPDHALVAGVAAGNIAVAAVKLGDRLDQVLEYVYTAGVTTDVLDLTAEFTISANGTINNTGGTDTTGNKLLVNWTKLTT